MITMSLLEIKDGFVINVLLDCPGDKNCSKYGVEYEGSTIVEGILNRLKVCVGGWGFEFEM